MCIGTPPYFFYEFSFIFINTHEYVKAKISISAHGIKTMSVLQFGTKVGRLG